MALHTIYEDQYVNGIWGKKRVNSAREMLKELVHVLIIALYRVR
jgi:hypothetical protein